MFKVFYKAIAGQTTRIKDIKGTNAVVVSMSSDNNISDESDVNFVEEDFIIALKEIQARR